MKRLLSWLLVLVMVFGLLPMSAFAVEVETENGDDDFELGMDELLPEGSAQKPYVIPYGNPRLGVMVNMAVPAGGTVYATADCTAAAYNVYMFTYDSIDYEVVCGEQTFTPADDWGSYFINESLEPNAVSTLEITNNGEADINITAYLMDTPVPGSSEESAIELNVSKAASVSETANVVDGNGIFYKVIAAEDGVIKVESSSAVISYTLGYDMYTGTSYTQVAAGDEIILNVGTSDWSTADVPFTVSYASDAEAAEIAAAQAVADQIDGLFTFNMETLENELAEGVDYATVAEIRAAYDALSDAGKAYVGDKVQKLEEAEELTKPEIPEFTVGTIDTVGKALAIEGVIFVNYYAKFNNFTGAVDQAYIEENGGLLVWDVPVTSEQAAIDFGTPDINEGLKFANASRGFLATTDGIPMAEYANEIYFCMYLKLPNGEYIYGEVIEYSVQIYAENQLSKPLGGSITNELKNMCATMLHFGAAAQLHFGVNTNDLANANILENWPAPAFDASLMDPASAVDTSIVKSASVTTIGKTLVFEGAIFINYYFRPSFTPASAELLFWTGVDGTLTPENSNGSTELVYTTAQGGSYNGKSDYIPAAVYGQTVYACAKFVDEAGNVHYSDVIAYSPEVYAANQLNKTTTTGAWKNLLESMIMYGEAARINFGK